MVPSINDGGYQTAIETKKDFQFIEKALISSPIKRDGIRVLSTDSIANVIQAVEKSEDYFDEYTDPNTNSRQFTLTNRNQGKILQLRHYNKHASENISFPFILHQISRK